MPPESAARSTTTRRIAAQSLANSVRKAQEDNPFEGIDVKVTHFGSKIVLPDQPARMDYDTGIETLTRMRDEEDQMVAINEQVDAYPLDGAVAFQKAMRDIFGWTSAVPTPTFFGPKPPQTLEVVIGPHPEDKTTVVWGRFELPNIEGHVNCGAVGTAKGPRFVINGEVKRKYYGIIRELAALTRRYALSESIYRHKAIKLEVGDDGEINWYSGITFTDLSRINVDELVFSESTAVQIKTSLWTLIEKTQMCRVHQVPLKRGVLMQGKYGTGKSLTSAVTAVKAVENGWTFLSLNRVSGLREAINFGRAFQPCVIFAEDVDSAASGEDRTVALNDILNTIDGIESKGVEIMVVLTTNHAEKINKAMMRPGRLDAVIDITPPDAQAVRKLIRLYGRSLLDADDPLEKCSEILAGQIPAMIRECTERAKLYVIGRSDNADDTLTITDEDIYNAAMGMKAHMDLLEGEVEEPRDLSFQELIAEGFQKGIAGLSEADMAILSTVQSVNGLTQRISGQVRDLSQTGEAIPKLVVTAIEEGLKRFLPRRG